MPTISKGDKVLITGANGYIAMWTTRLFLEQGYSVRGTLRSEKKANFLKDYFRSLGIDSLFETVIVEDIVKEGAFDEAVKDVDAIAHLATPFPDTYVKDPEDIIRPAVQGTVGILQSARKNGDKVKRIVVTSSSAAVMSRPDKPTTFSELDWNTADPKQFEERGTSTPGATIYRASKVLAERGAWNYYERHKNEVQWDLTVLNPPGVFGPPIHDVQSPTTLNTSLDRWCEYVMFGFDKTKHELSDSNCWVDVRDIALAHVLTLEKPEVGGERIIVTEGPYIFQEWLDLANSIDPAPSLLRKLPVGLPEILEGNTVYKITYDTSKQERILGIKYHSKLKTTKDTLEDFAKRGW